MRGALSVHTITRHHFTLTAAVVIAFMSCTVMLLQISTRDKAVKKRREGEGDGDGDGEGAKERRENKESY